jgi:putative hydrolase of the HAD superfamily
MNYEHVFFDLDNTLWDYHGNALTTLSELYTTYELADKGIPDLASFVDAFNTINDALWIRYAADEVSKEELRVTRFLDALGLFGITDSELAESVSDDYIDECPRKPGLMPNAMEAVKFLHSKYKLHIITNGFEEVQTIKIDHCGIRPYFDQIITSEMAGVKKPHPDIFTFAMERSGAGAANSIFVGDNLEADIQGAQRSGMHQVYYNPAQVPHTAEATYEISDLKELEEIL